MGWQRVADRVTAVGSENHDGATEQGEVWLDTDPGIDDALAITLAVAEGVRIRGLSSVAGNVGEDLVAANLVRLREALRSAIPSALGGSEIVRGATRPLLRSRMEAVDVHGADGLGGSLPGADPAVAAALPRGAAQRLLALAPPGSMWPGTLVALGPLTNVATAVLSDRTWPLRLSRLVVMGGSIAAGGNATPAAEFNFLADPEAAQITFTAGFPRLDLVPIDAGATLALGREQLEHLRQSPKPLAQLAARLVSYWAGRISVDGMIIYDAIAWLTVRHPELFTWRDLHVEVETTAGAGYGASFADRTYHPAPPNCRVAMGAAAEAYWNLFLSLLDGQSPPAELPPPRR